MVIISTVPTVQHNGRYTCIPLYLLHTYAYIHTHIHTGFALFVLCTYILLLQDFAFDYSFLAESFETSVPWNR